MPETLPVMSKVYTRGTPAMLVLRRHANLGTLEYYYYIAVPLLLGHEIDRVKMVGSDSR